METYNILAPQIDSLVLKAHNAGVPLMVIIPGEGAEVGLMTGTESLTPGDVINLLCRALWSMADQFAVDIQQVAEALCRINND